MAYESNTGLDWTFIAAGDMEEPYVAVALASGDDEVDLPAGTSALPVGITQAEAVEGSSVPVRLAGITKVVAHAAFAKGALLGIGATTGRLATVSPVDATWDGDTVQPIGIALEAAQNAGEVVAMLIRPLKYGT